MQSEDKLMEARYFLNKLEHTSQDAAHESEFKYNLSAFLSAWRSVIDVILYDYSEKFHLCFSRDESMTPRDFEIAARATNNTNAMGFIRWYAQQVGSLSRTPLSTKRNIIVHRGYPPTMHAFSVTVAESIAISSSFTIGPGAIPTNVVPLPNGTTVQAPATPTVTTTVNTRFQDLPNVNILNSCSDAVTLMQNILNDTIARFGR